jgi:hypothetical protein
VLDHGSLGRIVHLVGDKERVSTVRVPEDGHERIIGQALHRSHCSVSPKNDENVC